jgi:hypothetical protein
MSTSNAIVPLKKIQFMQTNNPSVCGLELTDFNDATFIAGVDAGGLAFAIGALLEQASHPDFTAASADVHERPALASVAGSAMTVVPGRAEGQLAVMLTVGSVELAIHLPRALVERAVAAMPAAT